MFSHFICPQPEKPSLSYESKQKRSKGDEDDDRGRRKKRRHEAGSLGEPFSSGQMTDEEKERIKQMVEAEPDVSRRLVERGGCRG